MTVSSPVRAILFSVAGLGLLVLGALSPSSARGQTAASVIAEMKTRYLDQFEQVDTYMVETDLYTSYHRKIDGSSPPNFESTTQVKGQSQAVSGMGSATQSPYGQLYGLEEHARHTGMADVDGRRCHVLQVDDPSKLDASLQGNATQIRYFIDAETYTPRRMQFEMQPQTGQAAPQQVTVTMKNYKTVEDLTLPWTIEIQSNVNETLSEQQKQQIKEMQEQMKQMDEEQRQMMERMMGDQMEQMQKMMSGEPIVVQVQQVSVNTPLPDGVFGDGSGSP